MEVLSSLEEIKSRSQMAVVLADIGRLGMTSDDVMSRGILEKILGKVSVSGNFLFILLFIIYLIFYLFPGAMQCVSQSINQSFVVFGHCHNDE